MSIADYSAQTIDGQERSLAEFTGRVCLIVNVASDCGFTPQYAGLEALWRRHRDDGFAVLGFPCNQFGAQESGDEAAIAAFCATTFRVTFPMFAKVEVNGRGAHPLFRYLKARAPGIFATRSIKWNFTKFLVDRRGESVRRYAPESEPEALEPDILALLSRGD